MLFKKETETKISSCNATFFYYYCFFFFLHFRILINRQVVFNTSIGRNNSVSEIFCLFKLSVARDIKDNNF